MRTMVARDNRLHLLFFRSQGMMAGPYIQLEKEVDDDAAPVSLVRRKQRA
jgi:hypothetical protein